MSGKFLYFAYGSNLLQKRIHINNPSAVRAGIGKLKDYTLDFNTYSKRWRGASATIVKKKGAHVWGALWTLDNEHMSTLDEQEGVKHNLYTPLTVEVECPNGEIRICRVYQQTNNPLSTDKIENLPEDRKPSFVYLKTILDGADESGLPQQYKEFLLKIPHNGYKGEVDIALDLHIN
ncbi:gamma-glutamylcyclotransferase-like [Coccinella septempunctata]|uniref:gamma-glutamylcyclotransferase-like n=1 Tax=Coccinella septempunctata TaxID=41139 RepID=UPI001D08BFA8|nr:gamma-glutamylcyclotransferase-like [Coccinella septempunctata]